MPKSYANSETIQFKSKQISLIGFVSIPLRSFDIEVKTSSLIILRDLRKAPQARHDHN